MVKRARSRSSAQIRRDFPWCVYCGGLEAATTVDHMPPKALFDHRRRPSGLEFPCCSTCNDATRISDLVASLLSRICSTNELESAASGGDFEDPPADLEYLNQLLVAVSNNVPGLLEEMMTTRRASAKLAARRAGLPADNIVNVGGRLGAHLEVFAAKLGFALHFLATGKVVPPQGGVAVAWRTNLQEVEEGIVADLAENLGPVRTLNQGKFSVLDQFGYKLAASEDGSISSAIAAFRGSFSTIAFAAVDGGVFERDLGAFRLFKPGDLKTPVPVLPYYRLEYATHGAWPSAAVRF